MLCGMMASLIVGVFIGYFNGCGRTRVMMLQGMIGAFGVRIPVSYFKRKRRENKKKDKSDKKTYKFKPCMHKNGS
jgi:hypothetical protein